MENVPIPAQISRPKQEFVLVYCMDRSNRDSVLTVLKNRPAHLAGKFNLPGGKVEPGEDINAAAIRELQEETGYLPNFRYGTDGPLYMEKMGEIRYDGGVIHCMFTLLTTEVQGPPNPTHGETEPVQWIPWNKLYYDPRLIPNLRVIIPLTQQKVYNWVITDNESSEGLDMHTFSVTVPTMRGKDNQKIDF
jgi:8-oxo-dGTP pyrophosphatase MutT (NUDIX family)